MSTGVVGGIPNYGFPNVQLQKAAEEGQPKAQFQLGEFYLNGQDIKKAVYWYQKTLETDGDIETHQLAITRLQHLGEAGEPEALFQLGVIFASGRRVEINRKIAKDYYRQAAQKGHLVALSRLQKIEEEISKDLRAEWERSTAEFSI